MNVSITESNYNRIPADQRGVWSTERTDLPDWPIVREQYMGKRTLLVLAPSGATALIVEGLGLEIKPDTPPLPAPLPGPYYVAYEDGCEFEICRMWGDSVTPGNTDTFGSSYGAHIATVRFTKTGVPPRGQALANAQLLAAAPALLAALDALLAEYGTAMASMRADAPRRKLWLDARAASDAARGVQ